MEGSRQTRISRPHKISESSKLYRWTDNSSQILRGLNEQRQRGHFCDIILVADDQKVPAHRSLLAACSDYFNSMFTIGMKEAHQKEVELVGASYIGLKAVIDFLYNSDLSLDGGNIDYVLETAHLLQLWKVVDFCCEYLENEVNEDNYLYLQELASIYSLERLGSYIDTFVLRNYGTLSFTTDFLQNVSGQKLCQYLTSNQVQHVSEHDLLQSALQWLTHCPDRESQAYQVLQNIRFQLIPKSDLLHRVKPAICSLLQKEANCQSLVEEALHYHNSVAAQPLLQNTRNTLRTGIERLLFVGGEVSEHCLELSDDVCSMDTKKEQWLSETQLPARRSHHCVTALGNFIYVAGGSFSRDNGGDAASSLLYRYDPRWSQWIKVASMNQHRVDFYLASVADKLVAVGGRNENGAMSSVESYCPQQDTWTYVSELPRFTYGHAGTVHKEFIYISGGHDYQIGPYRKNMLCYDHRADAWEERRPMITSRGWHSMCTLDDSIYAIGGSDDNLESMERFDILSVECYSPQCNQWTRISPLLQPNSESGVAVLDGKIYILGGYSWENTAFSRTVQLYDKEKNKWSRGTDLPKAIAGVSACVCVLKSGSEDRNKKTKTKRHSDRGW
ncbi:kelch-like protein 36 [Spea bombifrons]|uniref:kelch-like protein 36 n=1 Tax=Spea bombifrons TaxID=233779 RepID=UPI00234A12E7|nr:kelch-like protein 36 [Spea bombifrons]